MNAPRSLVGVLVILLAIGACGGAQRSGPASGASGAPGASPGGSGAASGAPSLPPGEFANPVLADDFPDPFVLRAGDAYYAYATTDGAQHLQLARSPDLVHWEELRDPLPKLPAWSSGDTWAPEVAGIGARFILYYTARYPDQKRPDGSGSQCITSAVADAAEGPFVDDSKAPFVCQPDLGGSIDGTYFRDSDGTQYLVWKNDGNCCGMQTRFFLQRLSADGRSVEGQPVDLGLVNDATWEGSLIEAPTMLFARGTYYLFYSANNYDSEFYAVGYATSAKVSGPFRDAAENPILASAWGHTTTSRARGPGHQSVVTTPDGELWMAYHAWDQDAVGYSNFGERELWIDRLSVDGGKASVHGPTSDPQPIP